MYMPSWSVKRPELKTILIIKCYVARGGSYFMLLLKQPKAGGSRFNLCGREITFLSLIITLVDKLDPLYLILF